MKEKKSILIVGAGETAELACDYFENDSEYTVAAFTVEREYIRETTFLGRPVLPFEEIEHAFPPQEHPAFVALSYGRMNRDRIRLFELTAKKGYDFVSYVSSRAFVGRKTSIGKNTMLMEDNVLQYGTSVGDNVILWSGNHIGHRTVIGNHTFLSSHIVVSGFCNIGERCFLGVNATVGDGVKIADDCLIGGGSLILADTKQGEIYRGKASKAEKLDVYSVFGIEKKGATISAVD